MASVDLCPSPKDGLLRNHPSVESPFCSACLPERVAQRGTEIGPTVVVEQGDHFVVMPLPLP